MNDEPLYRNKEWLYNQFIIQAKEVLDSKEWNDLRMEKEYT